MLNRLIRFTLVSVFATAVAGYGVSYAQPDDDDDMEDVGDEGGDEGMDDDDDMGGGDEGGGDEGGGDEGGGDEGGGDEGGGGDTAAPAADGAYPMAVIDRPLVLPKGAFEARVAIAADKEFEFVSMGIGAGYGVAPKIEAGLMYGFALKEFEIKGGLTLYGDYSVMKNDKMEVTAGASFGYDLLGEAMAPLSIGAMVKYLVTPKIAVLSDPHVVVYLEGDVKPIYLSVPIGLGFQATPQIWAQLDTQLANIEIADSSTGFIGADFFPVQLSAMYSLDNKIDVGAGITMDLKPPDPLGVGDTLGFIVMAALRGGALGG